jgi:hypothetical protein
MKIKAEITLDVDVDAWTSSYNIAPEEVKTDVKAYLEALFTNLHPDFKLISVK